MHACLLWPPLSPLPSIFYTNTNTSLKLLVSTKKWSVLLQVKNLNRPFYFPGQSSFIFSQFLSELLWNPVPSFGKIVPNFSKVVPTFHSAAFQLWCALQQAGWDFLDLLVRMAPLEHQVFLDLDPQLMDSWLLDTASQRRCHVVLRELLPSTMGTHCSMCKATRGHTGKI